MRFDYRDVQGRSWDGRYPVTARGVREWQRAPVVLGRAAPMERVASAPAALPRPCLFISHRRDDDAIARRIAWIANATGFDFWLDVLDPTNQALNMLLPGMSNLTNAQRAAVIASTIEMGLLNSTQVLAIWTNRTRGSAWVPYEYGRVKADGAIVASTASCYFEPACFDPVPEYMLLGPVHRNEAAIRTWLTSELTTWRAQPGNRYVGPPEPWVGPAPAALAS